MDEVREEMNRVFEIIDNEEEEVVSSCCGGSAMTEMIQDDYIGVAICSICRDWADFEYEGDEYVK